jgi:MFS family permease
VSYAAVTGAKADSEDVAAPSSSAASTSAASSVSSPAAAQKRLTVGLIAIVSITAFDALAASTILPAVLKELGGLSYYGGAFGGFMLTNVVSIIVAGRHVDRRGIVKSFFAGCALFAFGLVVAGIARAMPVVVLGRMVQGFGAGAISSVSYVAVARGYSQDERPRMLALISTAWVVPGLVGPAIATQIAEHLGWRWVFLGLVPMTALAAGVALPGLARLQPAPEGAPTPRFVDYLAVGSADAGTARIGRSALVAMMLLTCAFFGTEAFVPLTLSTLRGQSLTAGGLAVTASTLSWTVGAWVQERLVRKQRFRTLARAGLLLLALGIGGFSTLILGDTAISIGVTAWTIAGLGMGVAFATLSLVVLSSPAPGKEGIAATALQLSNVVGSALGTGFGGGMVALAVGLARPQAFGVAATLVAMAVSALAAFAVAGRLSNA